MLSPGTTPRVVALDNAQKPEEFAPTHLTEAGGVRKVMATICGLILTCLPLGAGKKASSSL